MGLELLENLHDTLTSATLVGDASDARDDSNSTSDEQNTRKIDDASDEIVNATSAGSGDDANSANARSSQPAGIDELLAQLVSRRPAHFEPTFPDVVLTDSDDDDADGVRVDEQIGRSLSGATACRSEKWLPFRWEA